MTRERKARVATIAILALALGAVVVQKTGWGWLRRAGPKADPTPQDAIYAMLDAARAGNVKSYMRAYAGQMEIGVRQSLAETGEPRFATYLKDSNSAIKGVAISEPQALSEREVKVRVEYVYQDRNEAQMMYLEKQTGGWKITRVDSAERVKTLVPYGTPVE